jgi:sugar/nucleoside kinase (ribokinase family)
MTHARDRCREVIDAVCAGILVADVIARPVDELPARGSLGLLESIELRGGGSALNTATVLRRLGLEVAVAGKVGRDAFGDFLLGLIEERGLRRLVARDASVPTSATVALVGADGERTFLHVPGANGALRADEIEVPKARALHLAGTFVMPALDGAPTEALLRGAQARGLVTSLDTVFDPTGRWERVLPCLPHAELFAPGYREGAGITGEREPERIARRLRELGAGEVAVTLGAAGCYASGEGFEGPVAGLTVAAVDGTGTGDAFSAGLLYGRLAGWGFERSVRFANAAGALASTAVGAAEGASTLERTLEVAGLSVSA